MFVHSCNAVRNTRSAHTSRRPLAERLEDRRLLSGVVYADFDADGDIDGADFLTVKAPDGDVDGADFLAIGVRLGNGDGTFGPVQRVSLDGVPGRVESLAAGDFNGDGQADLLTAGTFGRGVNQRGIIGVLIGHVASSGTPTGTVTFGQPLINQTTPVAAEGQPVVGDWDADGRDDLAIIRRSGFTDILISSVTPDGTAGSFMGGVFVGLDLPRGVRVAAGDVNGDGLDDLAYVGGRNRSLHIVENLGDGVWDDTDIVHINNLSLTKILVGVVTDNGTDDIVILRNGRAHVFEGDPQRLVGLHVDTSPIDLTVKAMKNAVLGDVNADGHIDLFSPVPRNGPLLAFGDGTGAFVR